MKILHTSDWHVGKVLKGQSRLDEQLAVLAEIVEHRRGGAARPGHRRRRPLRHRGADGRDQEDRGTGADRAAPPRRRRRGRSPATTTTARELDALRPWADGVGITLRGTLGRAEDHLIAGVTAGGEAVAAGRAAVRLPALRRAGVGDVRAQRRPRRRPPTPTTSPGCIAALTADFADGTDDGQPGRRRTSPSSAASSAAASATRTPSRRTPCRRRSSRRRPTTSRWATCTAASRSPGPCPVHYCGSPLAVDFGEEENTPSVSIVEVTRDQGGQGAGGADHRGRAAADRARARWPSWPRADGGRRPRGCGSTCGSSRGPASGRTCRRCCRGRWRCASTRGCCPTWTPATGRSRDRPLAATSCSPSTWPPRASPTTRSRCACFRPSSDERGEVDPMRPLRLDLHGFTVFREPTTVDLTDADFFALVGPTGSGKSTVLDAICFALYGTVPRWGDRRRIENALAPSAAEARVRLVFEASGRPVRRDPGGPPRRQGQGLHRRTPGWSSCRPASTCAAFDTAPAERGEAGLGTVLAGTPAEMDAAVVEAVGLPYEQFTSCVVLPQGEFARFLHAKPAERQEILVNLLGLHVYQRIGERAGVVQREAEAKAAATRSVLGRPRRRRRRRARRGRGGAGRGAGARWPRSRRSCRRWPRPRAAGETAAGRPGPGRAARSPLLARGAGAADGVATLGDEVAAARERGGGGRAGGAGRRGAGGEAAGRAGRARATATALRRLVDAHADRDRPGRPGRPARRGGGRRPRAEHDRAAAALATAAAKAAKAPAGGHRRPSRRVEAAQTADRAAALRVHLVAGEPCPVCDAAGRDRAGDARGARARRRPEPSSPTAEKAAQAAEAQAADARPRRCASSTARLAAATAQHEESAQPAGRRWTTQLADAPDAVHGGGRAGRDRRGRARLAAGDRRGPGAPGRTPRRPGRRARAAEERLREAWRDFDRVRDGAGRARPAAGRPGRPRRRRGGAAAWAERGRGRAGQRPRRRRWPSPRRRWPRSPRWSAELDAPLRRGRRGRRSGRPATRPPTGRPPRSRSSGPPPPTRGSSSGSEQAARLAEQVAEHEREAQVAKSLALHLRANQFERWLLDRGAGRAGRRRLADPAGALRRPVRPGPRQGRVLRRRPRRRRAAPGRADAVRRRDLPGLAGPGAGAVRAARRPVDGVGQPGVDHAGRGLRHARRGHPGHGRGDAGEPRRPRRPDGRRGHPRRRAGRADPGPVRGQPRTPAAWRAIVRAG